MRNFIFLILLLHGFLHLPGFFRSKKERRTLNKPYSGWYWLMSFLLFITTAIVFVFDASVWYYLGVLSVVCSQYAIILNWQRAKTGTAVNLIILLLILFIAYGQQTFLKHNVRRSISMVQIVSVATVT